MAEQGRLRTRFATRLLSDGNLTKKASLNALVAVLDYGARVMVGLIVSPLMLSRLGQTMFGAWQFLQSLIGHAGPASGRPGEALKWVVAYQQSSDDQDAKRREVGNAIAVWALFAPLLVVVGGVLGYFAPLWLHLPAASQTMVRVAAALLVANLVIQGLANMPQSVLYGENLAYKRVGLSTSVVFFGGVMSVLALVLHAGPVHPRGHLRYRRNPDLRRHPRARGAGRRGRCPPGDRRTPRDDVDDLAGGDHRRLWRADVGGVVPPIVGRPRSLPGHPGRHVERCYDPSVGTPPHGLERHRRHPSAALEGAARCGVGRVVRRAGLALRGEVRNGDRRGGARLHRGAFHPERGLPDNGRPAAGHPPPSAAQGAGSARTDYRHAPGRGGRGRHRAARGHMAEPGASGRGARGGRGRRCPLRGDVRSAAHPAAASSPDGVEASMNRSLKTHRLVYWLLLLVFTVPWENIIQFGGIGRISRAAGLLVALVWTLSVIRSGRIRLPSAVHVALLAFVLWNGLSVFWTVDLVATTERFFTYVQIFVFVYIMWDVLDTPKEAALSVPQAYVLGAWVTAASVIITYASNGLSGYEDRVATGTFQFTDMGLILVFGIPFAWYLASTAGRTSRLMKLVNMAYIPVGAYAVMLTGSRAAIVSMAAAVLYILVTLLRGRLAFKVLGLVVIGA